MFFLSEANNYFPLQSFNCCLCYSDILLITTGKLLHIAAKYVSQQN